MAASPGVLFIALTEGFDTWFAAPGKIVMRPREGEPFVFQTLHEGRFHSHYGRFVKLIPDRLVEMTWVTGDPGTRGAETLVSFDLRPAEPGTALRLVHSGFEDAESVARHESAWETVVLPHLDAVTSAVGPAPAVT
ncbi:uncharacterized protein YndB with AHSA1/START domain [Conyzicola lurida]|uniref:Uncharacterized protein YndB with AHSA1/START domain n=1 Tax=Conyzicola lurida TaxID=1172621 RepID=A0A841ANW2_9MICO|nr:SRPBCC domain-containing protein [Conyzicola lurida]MBB5844004.1 uncharacterized protein YndB with AHSA1/START domain [Conyzicola lurida]